MPTIFKEFLINNKITEYATNVDFFRISSLTPFNLKKNPHKYGVVWLVVILTKLVCTFDVVFFIQVRMLPICDLYQNKSLTESSQLHQSNNANHRFIYVIKCYQYNKYIKLLISVCLGLVTPIYYI